MESVSDSGGSKSELVDNLLDKMSAEEKKSLKSWYWYDWANQAFALTVLTVVVPFLLSNLFNLATGGGKEYAGWEVTGDGFYAIVLAISSMFVAISSPILGAVADRMPIKKKILWIYTIIGIVFTALMGISPFMGEDSSWKFLAICLVIGNIGFAGGNVIYYAFMPYLADYRLMDHVSSWGYAYGYAGGSLLLIVHLVVGTTGFFGLSTSWSPPVLSFVFITSALWWLGFGMPIFKNTPEPEIPNPTEYESLTEAMIDGFREVGKTFKEIKKYKVLVTYLIGYLLFYDGINTIGAMASAFADSVLRINPAMNFVLLLMVNITAIPMSVIGGRLASKHGTKKVLGVALSVYCVVAVLAVGFAPLDLDDDHERYDFQYDWNEDEGVYELSTLYDKGVDGWVSKEGAGDAEFRDSFLSFLKEGEDERTSLNLGDAGLLAIEMDQMTEHRFSFSFSGGELDESASVGDGHPSIIEGGMVDWWPNFLRDNVWGPAGFGVNFQWILLGMMVGMVMGTAGAQARSLFGMLIPASKTTEFFGFFGFIGKAAAVFGPLIYFVVSSSMDSRMALLSIVIVILLGMLIFLRIDVEEGIRVAKAVDAEAGLFRGEEK